MVMEFNIKHLGFKKTSIIILIILISILLNLNTMNSFAENSNISEKIKSTEKSIVWSDNKYNIYYSLGEAVIGVLLDERSEYNKLCFMDKNLKEIAKPMSIDKNNNFSYNNYSNKAQINLMPVSIDKEFGYSDKSGKKVVDFKYDRASNFPEGKEAVRLGNKWGYVDKTGKNSET